MQGSGGTIINEAGETTSPLGPQSSKRGDGRVTRWLQYILTDALIEENTSGEEITWRTFWKRPNLSSDSKDKPEETRQKRGEYFQHTKYNMQKLRGREMMANSKNRGMANDPTIKERFCKDDLLGVCRLGSLSWNLSPALLALWPGSDMPFTQPSYVVS